MDPWFALEPISSRHHLLKDLVQKATQAAFDTFDSVTIADLATQGLDNAPTRHRARRRTTPPTSSLAQPVP